MESITSQMSSMSLNVEPMDWEPAREPTQEELYAVLGPTPANIWEPPTPPPPIQPTTPPPAPRKRKAEADLYCNDCKRRRLFD